MAVVTRRISRSLLLGALVLCTSSCATRMALVTLEEAEDYEVGQHRITLQGRRIPVKRLEEPVLAPSIWCRLEEGARAGDVLADRAAAERDPIRYGFTLTFLAENGAERAWTLERGQFRLRYPEEPNGGPPRTLLPVSDAPAATSTEGQVLVFLPPGESATLRVPFAITCDAPVTEKELLASIYELEVVDGPNDARLLRRRLEVGAWHPTLQGLRVALVATLVFFAWGALG